MRKQRDAGKIGRVAFLVQNESLAFQQGEAIAQCLRKYRTKVFSGSVHSDKHQYLWDFLERYLLCILHKMSQSIVLSNKRTFIHHYCVF